VITKEKMLKCAEAIVNSLNLKRGEAVVVRGGAHTQELLEEIALLCYKQAATPMIMAETDEYWARLYEEVPVENLKITPKHYLGTIKEADAYIIVEPFKDPNTQTKFPRERFAARQEAMVPVRKELYGEETGRGKKWTYAGWPTREAANFYNVNYDEMERLIIEGIMVPASTLKRTCVKLAEHLEGKDVLHITDSKGTDFVCDIKGRKICQDDGIVDDYDIKNNDLANNLPAGEVCIAPLETFGKGTLYCPITVDTFNNIVKDVTLHFKDGQLLLEECTAGTNQEVMIDSFKRCMEIDKKEQKVWTTNIAELGIGCNPAIDKAIGYILTDEKIGGSVHLAFGSSVFIGGTTKSSMHWDFVTHPTATIEIVKTNELIMKEGKINQST